jgi:hypothetical protein
MIVTGTYFVASTYLYFNRPQGVRYILAATICFLLLFIPILVVGSWLTLASPFASDRVRNNAYTASVVNILGGGIFLSTLLGLFGLGGKKFVLLHLGIPYWSSLIIVSVYMLFVTVPYIVGLTRRKTNEADVYSKIAVWAKTILQVIDIGSDKVKELGNVKLHWEVNRTKFVADDPFLSHWKQISEKLKAGGNLSEQDNIFNQCAIIAGTGDLRFFYLTEMKDLMEKLDVIMHQYTNIAGKPDPSHWLTQNFRTHFKELQEKYEKMMEVAGSRTLVKPVAEVVSATVITAAAVATLGDVLFRLTHMGA